ncbi:histone deacetylase 6-like isoform X2 [Liolophura sinensis]|uniref:histone deacetylase 6-like isoform X2 n=1 Tax=Liolophura sinensis TaxID=3198878 RepID=UPI00315851B0
MSAWDWEAGENYVKDMLQGLNLRMEDKCRRRPQRTGFLYDDRMTRHYCSWNPEYTEIPGRLLKSYERCQEYGLVERCHRVQARHASQEEMTLLHDEELVLKLKETASMTAEETKRLAKKYDYIYFHPDVYDNSRLALGSSIEMVDKILSRQVRNGMALVRPPGHHAMRSKFCGYCYLNNVATAAQFALDNYGLNRVLIVDWDVHHGQGTQYMFYDDPRVLYFSIHRHEHGVEWPNLDESEYTFVGDGAGQGYNVNVPLNVHGCGDSDYMAIILQVLLPVAFEFRPELILVSAGYDAALGCPEGEMQVTPAFFAHVVNLLSPLADGQLCLILEGGYCLQSLAEGVALSLAALLGDPCPQLAPLLAPCSSVRESILNCLKVLRCYWKSFCYQGSLAEDNIPEFPSLLQWPVTVNQDRSSRETFSLLEPCFDVKQEAVIAGYVQELERWIANLNRRKTNNRVCLGFHEKLLQHRSLKEVNHPECPERLTSIMSTLERWGLLHRCILPQERSVTEEELSLVHSSSHIRRMMKLSALDEEALMKYPGTFNSVFVCKDTYAAASQAVGTVLSVVDAVMKDEATSGVAVIRPPGHHACEGHPMGYCIFNNVAIAAKYAMSKFNVNRVLYVSLHRFDDGRFFPYGSDGNMGTVGEGSGKGFSVNIPWRLGRMGDSEYIAAFQQIILPIAYEFCPDLVLVSAGFDAAREDDLGGYKLSPQCFALMTNLLMGLANGRIVLALEGGYNQEMTSAGLCLCTSVLLGDTCPPLPEPQARPSPSAVETMTSVIGVQKQFWKTLCFCVDLPDEDRVRNIGGLNPNKDNAAEEGKTDGLSQDEELVCHTLSDMTVRNKGDAKGSCDDRAKSTYRQ